MVATLRVIQDVVVPWTRFLYLTSRRSSSSCLGAAMDRACMLHFGGGTKWSLSWSSRYSFSSVRKSGVPCSVLPLGGGLQPAEGNRVSPSRKIQRIRSFHPVGTLINRSQNEIEIRARS